MPEKIQYGPLGYPIVDIPPVKPRKTYIINVTADLDPKTGSTTPNYKDTVDLEELVQTYRDQCGMDAALRLLKTGQATQADFADDGNHSGETNEDLENIQMVSNAAILASKGTASLADQLDLPEGAEKMTEEQLATLIAKTIQEKYPNMIKKEDKPNAE